MQCFLYILENQKGKHYIGITKLHPEERLSRHNKGDVLSTRHGAPLILVCVEKYDNYQEARKREKQIKSWHGGATLKRFLHKAAGSSNGRM